MRYFYKQVVKPSKTGVLSLGINITEMSGLCFYRLRIQSGKST